MKCTLLTRMLIPQAMINDASRAFSGRWCGMVAVVQQPNRPSRRSEQIVYIEPRSAEAVEEGMAGVAIQQSHVSGIGIGKHVPRGRARRVPRSTARPSDRTQSSQLIRSNRASPLGPRRRWGYMQAIWGLRANVVGSHLLAKKALREGMIRIAVESRDSTVLDRRDHSAGVGTVERADRMPALCAISKCAHDSDYTPSMRTAHTLYSASAGLRRRPHRW